jgi:hypothetical protein
VITFHAAIGLSVAVALGVGASFAWIAASPDVDFDHPFQAATTLILNVAGIVWGLYNAKQLDDEDRAAAYPRGSLA